MSHSLELNHVKEELPSPAYLAPATRSVCRRRVEFKQRQKYTRKDLGRWRHAQAKVWTVVGEAA